MFSVVGTGKTTILQFLILRTGLSCATQSEILAATDVLGGVVGETETKLRSILRRGWATPWLPICIIIDEVDAIVPDREHLKGTCTFCGFVWHAV